MGDIRVPEGTRPWQRVYVRSQSELSVVLPCLLAADAIGVDLETGQRYGQDVDGNRRVTTHVSLVQLAASDLSVVVDVLRMRRGMRELRSVFTGRAVKAFVDANSDIPLLEALHLPVRHVCDVAEVARSAWGEHFGSMQTLAARILGTEVDKGAQRSRWLRRPLSIRQIEYAHLDAEMSLEIYYWMRREWPVLTELHTRTFFSPPIPPQVATWLSYVLTSRTRDPGAAAAFSGLDPSANRDRIVEDMRAAMEASLPPRQLARLIRAAGDLDLSALTPDIKRHAKSPSGFVRGAVARTLTRLDKDSPVLESLRGDANPDVAAAAEIAKTE